MRSNLAFSLENISKSYRIKHRNKNVSRYYSLRDVVANSVKTIFHKDEIEEEFWALKDINFDISQGDRVGIIGRNGSGKSTLLKLLSRITEPTTGRIQIRGKVASLLEVGTGFHAELTGRENIFLNGAILGMSRKEIRSKFDEIVDFAQIEKFLDTPVKRYSSGMYVRLAFSVAAHLEPDVLLVDEVLAVGDAAFQAKCMEKMREVSAEKGRTILFVSHSIAAVEALCQKGIMLDRGNITSTGDIDSVLATYLSTNSKHSQESLALGKTSNIIMVDILNESMHRSDELPVGETIIFEITLDSRDLIDWPRVAISIHSPSNERLATIHTDIQQNSQWHIQGLRTIRAVWINPALNVGKYRVDVALWGHSHEIETLVGCKILKILPKDIYGTGMLPDPRTQGSLVPNAKWDLDVIK